MGCPLEAGGGKGVDARCVGVSGDGVRGEGWVDGFVECPLWALTGGSCMRSVLDGLGFLKDCE